MGQGDTQDNKEEFWKKNCPLALLQTTQMGFPLQQVDHLKSGAGPCSQSMQVCFVRGDGSPCSHAGCLACNAPVHPKALGDSESRHGST
jgi:hypothetical protein